MNKNRDLAELAYFQSKSIEFCQQVCEVSRKLLGASVEAGVALKDDVSVKSIHRVEELAEKLRSVSEYGQREMTKALRKTRTDQEQWDKLL